MKKMVREQRLELRLTVPETAVLPLDDSRMKIKNKIIGTFYSLD